MLSLFSLFCYQKEMVVILLVEAYHIPREGFTFFVPLEDGLPSLAYLYFSPQPIANRFGYD